MNDVNMQIFDKLEEHSSKITALEIVLLKTIELLQSSASVVEELNIRVQKIERQLSKKDKVLKMPVRHNIN
jgi:replicative DNA helicase